MKCQEYMILRHLKEIKEAQNIKIKQIKMESFKILLQYGFCQVYKESLITKDSKLQFRSFEEHGRFEFCEL